MNEVKNILVLGGAGYLGSVLTRQLLDRGHQVRVLDSFRFGQDSLADVMTHPRLEVAQGDIRAIDQVTGSLDGVDGVILLASLVGEPACDVDPKETVDINFLATSMIAEACRYYRIERFIFASTDSVYGIREGIMREDSEMNPISLYGRLKLEAEARVLSLQDDSFHPTILRMATLYGYSPRMRFDLVVNTLTMHATMNGAIKIFGGKQWRPFVHVSDAARAYQLALEAPLPVVGGQVFNVGSNDQNHQIGELGTLMGEIFPDLSIETIPQAPDLRDYYVNCDKIAQAIGFRAEKSIADGVLEVRDFLKSGVIQDPTEGRYYNVHRR